MGTPIQDKLLEIYTDAVRERWDELSPLVRDLVAAKGERELGEFMRGWAAADRLRAVFNGAVDARIQELMQGEYAPLVDALARRDAEKRLEERYKRRGMEAEYQAALEGLGRQDEPGR